MKIRNIQVTNVQDAHFQELNNVAVKYFEKGLYDVACRIWHRLYHEMKADPAMKESNIQILPVIICNLGNVLWQLGYDAKTYYASFKCFMELFENEEFLCVVSEKENKAHSE